ncbi:response regulator [Paenibacillus larvae]|uniref:response regulator n=1 Tax=Paenibacillus larvae TaxID=1464 RepID=UPI0028F44FE6|nr:response regulator transcription factor [Paenibacillus larvae]
MDEARRQLVDYAKMVEKTAQAEQRRRISRALHDRESLRMLLGMQEELNVMGTCENGAEALKWLMEGNEADVILMDNRMPECDGVEGTKQIHEQFPSIKILVLATFDDDEFIIEALRNGACGYLLKNVPPEQIVHGIKTVYQGNWLIHPDISKKLTGYIQAPTLFCKPWTNMGLQRRSRLLLRKSPRVFPTRKLPGLYS